MGKMNKDYVTKTQMFEYAKYLNSQIDSNFDSDEKKLDNIPFEKIERYVRKKKLDRIKNKK